MLTDKYGSKSFISVNNRGLFILPKRNLSQISRKYLPSSDYELFWNLVLLMKCWWNLTEVSSLNIQSYPCIDSFSINHGCFFHFHIPLDKQFASVIFCRWAAVHFIFLCHFTSDIIYQLCRTGMKHLFLCVLYSEKKSLLIFTRLQAIMTKMLQLNAV